MGRKNQHFFPADWSRLTLLLISENYTRLKMCLKMFELFFLCKYSTLMQSPIFFVLKLTLYQELIIPMVIVKIFFYRLDKFIYGKSD